MFIPFTIGGGVREVADAHAVLDAGADKVSINSAALARPELIGELAQVFGAQCVVLAIDAKKRPDGSYEAYVAGGRTPTGRDAVAWAREGAERGAGEILLTSMDTDGVGTGYELELTRAVSYRRRGPGHRVRRRRRAAPPDRGHPGRRRRRPVRLDLPLRAVHDPGGQVCADRGGNRDQTDFVCVISRAACVACWPSRCCWSRPVPPGRRSPTAARTRSWPG